MGLATGGLPGVAASGNRTVVAVTTPRGELVWTSWELGEGAGPWTSVPIGGAARFTDVAPAVSFRTAEGGAVVWLAIKDTSDNFIYETLQDPDGQFNGWTRIPGLQTNVSPAATDGNLAIGAPMMVALATPPDDRLRINVFLADQPPEPPPPDYWQDIDPATLTSLAPAAAVVDNGSYIFVATTSLNFGGPNGLVLLNQGDPNTPGEFVGFEGLDMNSNLSPAMASARNRTVIRGGRPQWSDVLRLVGPWWGRTWVDPIRERR
jgi:hypothetical protein